jgi:hypothetical protein
MRSSTSTHLVWALLVVVAFLIGLFVDGHRSSAGADSLSHKGAGADPSDSTAAGASEIPVLVGMSETGGLPAFLSPEQARTATFELLSEPKRMERLSRLCDLLRRVTPENWRDVMDAFVRQTAFEGREHGEEWKLMLHRVGEVAGSEAVLDALNSNGMNRDHRARNALEGWAMASPDAALAWLQAQTPENQKILIPAMLYGLARSSPVQALDFALAQKDSQTRNSAIPDIVNGAVQQGGFRKGEELLASAMNRPGIDETMKKNLFYALTQKRLAMARLRNAPMDSLQWLDGYLGESSPVGPIAVREVVASAAAVDPSAAMQWLDQRAERLTPALSIPGYTAALQAVYKQSPQQFTTWLTANQTHPAHDVLVEAYTNDLIAFGRTTEASEWMNTVQDATRRQRIQAALQKSMQQNAKRP